MMTGLEKLREASWVVAEARELVAAKPADGAPTEAHVEYAAREAAYLLRKEALVAAIEAER